MNWSRALVAGISTCEIPFAACGGTAFEILDQPVDTKLRLPFYEPMHMVRHDLQSDGLSLIFRCRLSNDLFTTFCDLNPQAQDA